MIFKKIYENSVDPFSLVYLEQNFYQNFGKY